MVCLRKGLVDVLRIRLKGRSKGALICLSNGAFNEQSRPAAVRAHQKHCVLQAGSAACGVGGLLGNGHELGFNAGRMDFASCVERGTLSEPTQDKPMLARKEGPTIGKAEGAVPVCHKEASAPKRSRAQNKRRERGSIHAALVEIVDLLPT